MSSRRDFRGTKLSCNLALCKTVSKRVWTWLAKDSLPVMWSSRKAKFQGTRTRERKESHWHNLQFWFWYRFLFRIRSVARSSQPKGKERKREEFEIGLLLRKGFLPSGHSKTYKGERTEWQYSLYLDFAFSQSDWVWRTCNASFLPSWKLKKILSGPTAKDFSQHQESGAKAWCRQPWPSVWFAVLHFLHTF